MGQEEEERARVDREAAWLSAGSGSNFKVIDFFNTS